QASARRWLYTTNHKDIGILYIITSLFLFAAAGVLAITMRTQLSTPDNSILNANVYNQFGTDHGLFMIFWVLSPFAFGFANFMMLYAFPSFLAAVVLLYVDRAFGTVYFSSIQGGSLLWDNVFWFFGHPEVYIVLFPAIGVIADIIPTFARRPLYGSKYVIGAL